jgi:sugar lactone lactonase YvrE
MTTARRTTSTYRLPIVLALGAAGSLAPAVGDAAPPETSTPPSPTPRAVATFGSGLGSGSTIGPDGALYVTDGNAGSVERVDVVTGETTRFATGLPVQVLGIGGAIDVAFVDETAYVLVTMVGGDVLGGDHIGDEIVGIYRVDDDGSCTVVADIGAWSIDHPPTTDYFLTTGVQYALEPFGNALLVSDGHHNRVLEVGLDGAIDELITFDNVVPTGLETSGDDVLVALAGALPHLPEDGQVMTWSAVQPEAERLAGGTSMIVDVERQGDDTFALAQGDWDGVQEGSPAAPDTGRLLVVEDDGTMTPVAGADGYEVVLDRPTSLELVGSTAYVVTLTGDIVALEHLVP